MAESNGATTTNSGMHYLSTMESAAYDDTHEESRKKLFVRAISPISNPYVPKADMKCSTASSNTDKADHQRTEFRFLECNGK